MASAYYMTIHRVPVEAQFKVPGSDDSAHPRYQSITAKYVRGTGYIFLSHPSGNKIEVHREQIQELRQVLDDIDEFYEALEKQQKAGDDVGGREGRKTGSRRFCTFKTKRCRYERIRAA